MPQIFDQQLYQRSELLPQLTACPLEWISREGEKQIDRNVIEFLSSALRLESEMRDLGLEHYSPERHKLFSFALRCELEAFEMNHLAPRHCAPEAA